MAQLYVIFYDRVEEALMKARGQTGGSLRSAVVIELHQGSLYWSVSVDAIYDTYLALNPTMSRIPPERLARVFGRHVSSPVAAVIRKRKATTDAVVPKAANSPNI